jgi:hypothetical protein
MITISERIIAGVCLVLALLGLANLLFMNIDMFGLSPKQLSIIMFVPGGIVAYYIRARPR